MDVDERMLDGLEVDAENELGDGSDEDGFVESECEHDSRGTRAIQTLLDIMQMKVVRGMLMTAIGVPLRVSNLSLFRLAVHAVQIPPSSQAIHLGVQTNS